MSAEAVTPRFPLFGARWTLTQLRILRYAIGSTLCVAIAMGFDWFLGYLVPVLALGFFASPAPRPSLKQGIAFVAVIFVACMVGYLFARYVIPYPIIFILLAGLGLMHIFYAKHGGVNALLITWLMIAITVVPLLSIQSLALAAVVIGSLVSGAAATILLIWLAYGIVPDPPEALASLQAAEVAKEQATPSDQERVQMAVLSTIVVLPLFTIF